MEVKLAVLADFASISREGKLNIMGIFDEMNPPSLPAGLPIFYIVVSYSTGPVEFETEKKLEIALQSEDGNILLKIEQEAHIPRPPRPGTRGTVNVVRALVGLGFEKAGTYEFVMSVDGHPDRYTIPFRINPPTSE